LTESIPHILGLQKLDLSHNKLTEVPLEMHKLENLSVYPFQKKKRKEKKTLQGQAKQDQDPTLF